MDSLLRASLWPGALLFLLYHDLAFLFGMPFSGKYLLHLLLAAMNLYPTIILVANVDATAVKQRLAGRVFEKTGGGVLSGLGVLFLLWAIAVMVNSLFWNSHHHVAFRRPCDGYPYEPSMDHRRTASATDLRELKELIERE